MTGIQKEVVKVILFHFSVQICLRLKNSTVDIFGSNYDIFHAFILLLL